MIIVIVNNMDSDFVMAVYSLDWTFILLERYLGVSLRKSFLSTKIFSKCRPQMPTKL